MQLLKIFQVNMKLLKFSQFINENNDSDLINQMSDYGLVRNTAEDVYDILIAETGLGEHMELEGDSIRFTYDWNIDIADSGSFGKYDIRKLGIERDFFGMIDIVLDFDKMMIIVDSDINQKDLNFNDSYSHEGPMSDYLNSLNTYAGKELTSPASTQELADDLVMMFHVWDHQEDPFGIWENINSIIEDELGNRLARSNEEDDEDDDTVLIENLTEKKKLKWHDSDAPDANGKFKELGVQKLADWLIRTRGRDMQKITGSLNQQIAFNKKKNPSYAKKMESTREAVKRKLKK